MDEVWKNLSWWSMPLSALGSEFLSFVASALAFMILTGLFLFILDRL